MPKDKQKFIIANFSGFLDNSCTFVSYDGDRV